MSTEKDTFYLDCPSFRNFERIEDQSAYRSVPEDWVVLAADIVQSRKAIEEGRGKAVNLIGAGVVAAVLNTLDRDRIPFVFGGDGAILLVPGNEAMVAAEALAGMERLAREQEGLSLRVAAIPLSDLRARGADVRLAKYELHPGVYLAMAIGGGIELSDKILKNEEEVGPYAIDMVNSPLPDLTGLSCRWESLPSEHGSIVSLILRPEATARDKSVLADVRKALKKVTGRDIFADGESGQLLSPRRLRFRFPPSGLWREIRLVGASRGRLKTALKSIFESLAFLYAHLTGKRVGPLEPARYLQEICRQTDHRKLDDSLRLVLDLTPDQIASLKTYLEQARLRGDLSYGLHEAPSATVTCFVSDLGESQHLHFIDGGNGGLSAAASALALAADSDRGRKVAEA